MSQRYKTDFSAISCCHQKVLDLIGEREETLEEVLSKVKEHS
jgi:hypothetical protein